MSYRTKQRTAERLEYVGRKIGTLLVAFAPLVVTLSTSPGRWFSLLIFLAVGIGLFVTALIAERWRIDVD